MLYFLLKCFYQNITTCYTAFVFACFACRFEAINMQTYEAQLYRLKQALNVESDNAFSQILGVSQGSVSGAKKRGQIPFAWFFQVAEKTNTSIDWLFGGHGSMRPGEGAPEPAPQAEKQPVTQDIAELKRELEQERQERRALAEENRRQARKIEDLLEDNGKLREEHAIMRERMKQAADTGKLDSHVA